MTSNPGNGRLRLAAAFGVLVVCLALAVSACSGDSGSPSAGTGSDGDAAAHFDKDASAPPASGSLRVIVGATLRTAEDGTRATFTVALGSRPTMPVIVPLASSNEGETRVEPSALTFTPDDWDRPKAVTLIGQNDDVADGDQPVAVAVGPASSADDAYNGVRSDPVAVTNTDDDTAGVETSAPFPSANTTEPGGQARFTVRLRSKPRADVTIAVASSRPIEGKPDKTSLVFTPSTWSLPQTVAVTGQDDVTADGDQPYSITLANAQSTDAVYAAIDPPDVALVNQDDDIPGFFVSGPLPSALTTEAGGTVTFTVRLRSKPNANVSVPVSSDRLAEGRPSVTALTFTPANYDQPQTVTVTGQDDAVDDDNQPYAIVLAPATSVDPLYAGLDAPDVNLTNQDDDTAGALVGVPAPSAQTTEAGGALTFTVKLASQPTATVTIAVASSKPAEGKPDLSQLVFTAGNWNVAQTVTVTGQDDAIDDGNTGYSITLAKGVSADAKYAAVDPVDVALTNLDDDTAGISVGAPLPGSQTSEGGASVTVAVVLQSQPTANVTIPVSVSKPAEGTADVVEVVFTPANWSVAQAITVTGKDDLVDDGDQAYSLVLGAAASADGVYAGLDPANVALTNIDDDTSTLVVSAPAPGNTTTELGGQVTFTVALQTEPTANVTVSVASTKAAEGTPDKAQLVFTAADWNVAQTVTVTGQNDHVVDPDVSYDIVLGTAASVDATYAALGPVSVPLSNAVSQSVLLTGGAQRGRILVSPPASVLSTAVTLEGWFRMDAASDYGVMLNPSGNCRLGYAGSIGYAPNVRGRLNVFSDLLTTQVIGTTVIPIGQWFHVAVTHDGATLKLFVNGTLEGSTAWPGYLIDGTQTLGNNPAAAAIMQFGGDPRADNEAFPGAIDEIRISTGVRYAANFVPPAHLAADASTRVLFWFDQATSPLVSSDVLGGPSATLVGSPVPGYTVTGR